MRQSTVKVCLTGLLIVLLWGVFPVGFALSQTAEGIQEEVVAQASTGEGESGGEMQASRGVIKDIRTDMRGEEVTIEVEASSNLQYTAFKLMEPLRLVLDFQDMDSTDKGQMEVNMGVVQTIRPMYFEDAGVQRLEIDLASTAVYEIQKPEDNRLLITLKGSPMEKASANEQARTKPAPTVAVSSPMADPTLKSRSADTCHELFSNVSDVVQVEFQNAELRNVFRFMAEFANINIVVAPGVSGGATLKVDSVPWNKVMELVISNYKLGRKCEGGVVRVGIGDDLVAERFMQPLITQMVRLNYGDPDEVIKNLDKMKSTFGKVVSDKRTNSIILTDTESAVAEMMEVVTNLDQPTHQVQIESKIIQINRDFLQELGIQWGFDGVSFRNPQFPNAVAFSGAARGDGFLSGSANAGGIDLATSPDNITSGVQLATPRINPGFIVDLATVGTPFGAVATSLRAIGGDLTLDLQLSALERQGKSKTVASPKVTTLNNKEAKIRSGTRLPFQTTDPAEGTKIQFMDAVIELRVTPQITSEDMIYMTVSAQQNSPDAVRNVGGVPVILTREAFTELLVADKDTAVIGGLFQKRISDTTRAIPYLSEIPIVGQIFKSNAETDNVSELLILIKPTIVKGLDS